MLKQKEQDELKILVKKKLDHAETIWDKVGSEMIAENARASMENFSALTDVDTQIPGYPKINLNSPKVDDFIAIVADMRDSTKHLLQAISHRKARVSQLQRVFYETSALLPALAKAISYKNGNVTEYLGDGVLGLFNASNIKENHDCIYDSYNAAKKCLCAVDEIVNSVLYTRYNLPPLKIGIGLALSKAVVTMTGIDDHYQPKVFGECVYRASKISGGNNQIYVDEALHYAWPTTKNGNLRFSNHRIRDIDAYLVEKGS